MSHSNWWEVWALWEQNGSITVERNYGGTSMLSSVKDVPVYFSLKSFSWIWARFKASQKIFSSNRNKEDWYNRVEGRDWDGDTKMSERGTESVFQLLREHTSQAPWESSSGVSRERRLIVGHWIQEERCGFCPGRWQWTWSLSSQTRWGSRGSTLLAISFEILIFRQCIVRSVLKKKLA